jgi:hypothetical protein
MLTHHRPYEDVHQVLVYHKLIIFWHTHITQNNMIRNQQWSNVL